MEGETVATVEATPQNLEEPSEEQSNPNPGGSTDQRSVEEKLADPTISKTQQKKLLRKQAQFEQRKEKKKDMKVARKDEVARRRTEAEKEFQALPEELKEARIAQRKVTIDARKSDAAAKKQRQQLAFENGQKLVIDLEFHDLMLEKERKSLMSQLMYCYAANNRAADPCRLVLTGLDGPMGELYHAIPGSQHWQVDAASKDYIEHFAGTKDQLVYLTADSTNEITELSKDKVYIIGGIVDHNRYKNLTLDKADKQGIAHARLPIGAGLKMLTSKVLTVNQVVEIVLNYLDTKDWHKALVKAIPKRKRGGEEDDDANEAANKAEDNADNEADAAEQATSSGEPDEPAAAAAAAAADNKKADPSHEPAAKVAKVAKEESTDEC